MPQPSESVRRHLQGVLAGTSVEEARRRLRPRAHPLPPKVPGASVVARHAVEKRWRLLQAGATAQGALYDAESAERGEAYARSIENYIGTVKVPVGLAGPLRVNGLFAQGDFYVPLATTEAALVASYARGALVVSEAGGASALLVAEGVNRAPGFAFACMGDAAEFAAWAAGQLEAFRAAATATTGHGRLLDLRVTLEGNHAYLTFDFLTGDASGQNMVTIATQAICDFIAAHSPVPAQYAFVEANLSGDKKASAQSFTTVRGKKVTAEVVVASQVVEKRLHATVGRMVDYWRMSALGGVMSGTIGVQGHYANGLAALFLACGQDVACVAEAAVGVTRFEAQADGALYASVTLPNLIVGTVGGGTGLPSQSACLDILGLRGEGKSRAFAELAAALALAGELSIIGALSSQQFTRAHQRRARR
jgi:hydroxymethylglutaryl-CoA reductase (NADPH)